MHPETIFLRRLPRCLTTALQARVSPMELLALGTSPPTKAGMTVALPCELGYKQSKR